MPTTLPERSAASREHLKIGAALERLERFADIAHRRHVPAERILAARREWRRIRRLTLKAPSL